VPGHEIGRAHCQQAEGEGSYLKGHPGKYRHGQSSAEGGTGGQPQNEGADQWVSENALQGRPRYG